MGGKGWWGCWVMVGGWLVAGGGWCGFRWGSKIFHQEKEKKYKKHCDNFFLQQIVFDDKFL